MFYVFYIFKLDLAYIIHIRVQILQKVPYIVFYNGFYVIAVLALVMANYIAH